MMQHRLLCYFLERQPVHDREIQEFSWLWLRIGIRLLHILT